MAERSRETSDDAPESEEGRNDILGLQQEQEPELINVVFFSSILAQTKE